MSYITDKWKGKEHFKINGFDHVEFYVGNANKPSTFIGRPLAFIHMRIVALKQASKIKYLMC